jgi:hypothetical protein
MAAKPSFVQGAVICPDGVTRDLRTTKTIGLYHSGRGFVYVGKARVYGTAGPYRATEGSRAFTPDGKNAVLVQPIPNTAAELDSGPLSVN